MSRGGFVYFVVTDIGTKIGMTKKLGSRLSNLMTSCPVEPVGVFSIRTKDPKGLEGKLHKKFSHLRIRGEWFMIGIEDAVEACSNPPSVEDCEEIGESNSEFSDASFRLLQHLKRHGKKVKRSTLTRRFRSYSSRELELAYLELEEKGYVAIEIVPTPGRSAVYIAPTDKVKHIPTVKKISDVYVRCK